MRGVLAWLVCVAPALLPAQTPLTVAQHIALGDSAHAALVPAQALAHFRAAYAIDTSNYEVLWKTGRELVDIAKQIEGEDDSSRHRRDSLYMAARAFGEAAVRRNPGIASSLSSVPPVWPSPRPDIIGTATPHAATSGASTSDTLSPTPPVECLSTRGVAHPSKASRDPEASIASVSAASSWRSSPRNTTAMSRAAIW